MNLPSTQEIVDDIDFLDDWESRYQYIIDLGKELPKLEEAERLPEFKVKGCQSDVWLIADASGEQMEFRVDSDAIIVRGLLGLVMAAYNKKTAAEITAFDINGYFTALDLERHLSPTRGNGLRAIVSKIQSIASGV